SIQYSADSGLSVPQLLQCISEDLISISPFSSCFLKTDCNLSSFFQKTAIKSIGGKMKKGTPTVDDCAVIRDGMLLKTPVLLNMIVKKRLLAMCTPTAVSKPFSPNVIIPRVNPNINMLITIP